MLVMAMAMAPMSVAGATTHRAGTPARPIGSLLASLHSPFPNPYNEFGTFVAVSGATAVVGFPGSAYDRAAVYIYGDHHGHWTLDATLHRPPGSSGSFGGQVAVSGTNVVVAGSDGNTLCLFLYTKDHAGWPTTPSALLPDPGTRNGFGSWVAIEATTIVAGFAGINGSSAGAYVFEQTAGTWATTPTAVLPDPGPASGGYTGSAVAISGTTIVVGSSNDQSTSSVYVYAKSAAGWPTTPTTTLADPSPGPGDLFGGSVAISGSTIVVGDPFADQAEGATYLYSEGSGGWPGAPSATLSNPSAPTHLFGASVAMSGSTIVICPWGGGEAPGAAYIYATAATGWPSTPTVTLSDPSTTVNDYFGDMVGVSGTTAIVASPGDRSAGTPASAYLFKA